MDEQVGVTDETNLLDIKIMIYKQYCLNQNSSAEGEKFIADIIQNINYQGIPLSASQVIRYVTLSYLAHYDFAPEESDEPIVSITNFNWREHSAFPLRFRNNVTKFDLMFMSVHGVHRILLIHTLLDNAGNLLSSGEHVVSMKFNETVGIEQVLQDSRDLQLFVYNLLAKLGDIFLNKVILLLMHNIPIQSNATPANLLDFEEINNSKIV